MFNAFLRAAEVSLFAEIKEERKGEKVYLVPKLYFGLRQSRPRQVSLCGRLFLSFSFFFFYFIFSSFFLSPPAATGGWLTGPTTCPTQHGDGVITSYHQLLESPFEVNLGRCFSRAPDSPGASCPLKIRLPVSRTGRAPVDWI